MKRLLITALTLALLIFLTVQVENWRGQREWERVQAEVTAKGVNLNWNDYVSSPIPDEQNLALAPVFSHWIDGAPLQEWLSSWGDRDAFLSLVDEIRTDDLSVVNDDPITGDPYRYQPLATSSFCLWSIGLDLEDNGGHIEKDNPITMVLQSEASSDVSSPSGNFNDVKLPVDRTPLNQASETVSVDFPDEEVSVILRNVTQLFDLKLIIPDSLGNEVRTSVKLRNVTWPKLFDLLLEPSQELSGEMQGTEIGRAQSPDKPQQANGVHLAQLASICNKVLTSSSVPKSETDEIVLFGQALVFARDNY